MPSTTVLTAPFGKQPQVKSFAVARTHTSGNDKAFVLPRGARLLGYILSGTASDAATTATLSVGTTAGTPVEHVNALDVKAAATGSGVGILRGVTGALQSKLTNDTIIYVKYAETGGASTVGSWTLTVVYVLSGLQGAGTE